jgi:hypothetical protein
MTGRIDTAPRANHAHDAVMNEGALGSDEPTNAFWRAYHDSPAMGHNPLQEALGIASAQEVIEHIRNPATVILDVRPSREVLRDGYIKMETNLDSTTTHRWLHMPCSMPEECQLLDKVAPNLIPDKESKYCWNLCSSVYLFEF